MKVESYWGLDLDFLQKEVLLKNGSISHFKMPFHEFRYALPQANLI